MLSNILDRISFYSLLVVAVLLPIFFLPFSKIPVDISKSLLLVVGLSISIICWTAARFSDGKIIFAKSWFLLSSFCIVFVFLLSSIFSPALKVSFFGLMLDAGTFYFMLACFLFMFLASVLFKNLKNSKMVLFGVILSSFVLFIFQIFRLFIPNILSLGVLGSNIDNIFGSFNALGIFAGLSIVTSIFIFEFFSISKLNKIFLYIFTLLALFFVIIVNFTTIWWLLLSFSLIIFVYKVSLSFSKAKLGNKKEFPIFPFIVIMISLLFLTAGQFVGNFLPNYLGISNLEVNPSFNVTMSVAKNVLVKSPILGSGPNRFSEAWSMYKPMAVNSSDFWSTSFDSGSGTLPTLAVTTGCLGILSILIFIVLLFFAGLRSFLLQRKNLLEMEIFVFFIMSLYLFVASFFYSVGLVLFVFAFIFLGIFIGLSNNGSKNEIEISLLNDPRKSFFSILALVLVMIISASALFKYVERFASVVYFQKTFTSKDINEAQSSINKAISLYSNDLYLRAYSQVYLLKINSLINKGSLTDADKADLKASFDQALAGAQLAESYDQTNFLNFESLGSVYTAGSSLGITDAYSKAIESYEKASSLNPFDPSIKLSLARIAFQNGDIQKAKDYASQSFALKGDYVDALIFLSQIAKNEGNNTDALSYAQYALSLYPQDQNLLQYVNYLRSANSTGASIQAPVSTSVPVVNVKNKINKK